MGCYFNILFSKTNEVIDTIIHQLSHPKLEHVDMIVGIGLSGTLPLLSLKERSGKNICAMRKDTAGSHGGHSARSKHQSECEYVIVDDFVSTGETLKKLRSKINKLNPRWKCAGVILYGRSETNGRSLEPVKEMFSDVPIFSLEDDIKEINKMHKAEADNI